jgi:hypothetical protein
MTTKRKLATIQVPAAEAFITNPAAQAVEEPVFSPAVISAANDIAAALKEVAGRIDSADTKAGVEKALKVAKANRKQITDIRFSFSRALDTKKAELMALEKELAGPIDAAIAAATTAVDAWNREQYRLQLEAAELERKRIADLAITQAASTRSEAKTTAIIENALQQAAAIPAPVLVPGTRLVKLFEVTNPELVPSEYLVVDETKIRAAITAGKLLIPGVKIWEDVERTGR